MYLPVMVIHRPLAGGLCSFLVSPSIETFFSLASEPPCHETQATCGLCILLMVTQHPARDSHMAAMTLAKLVRESEEVCG